MYFNGEHFQETLLRKLTRLSDIHGDNEDLASENLIVADGRLKHVIIDCSAISCMDYSGGKSFIATMKELNDQGLTVYLSSVSCK